MKKKDTIGRFVKVPLHIRFWEKVKMAGPDQCWIWTADTIGGYGKIKVEGIHNMAHRVSYTMHKGPIPKGLHVCHSCDNPPCGNPNHLWLGTVKENMADRDRKGRGKLPYMLKQLEPKPLT